MRTSYNTIRAVAVIATDLQGRIFLVKEKESDIRIGKVAGQLSLPAGRIEDSENAYNAIQREFREETGCALVSATQIFYCNLYNDGPCVATIRVFQGKTDDECTAHKGELETQRVSIQDALQCINRPPMLQILELWHNEEVDTTLHFPFSCSFESSLSPTMLAIQ